MRKLTFARFLTTALVASLLAGTAVGATQNSDMLPLYQPSATGSFLAGRQALDDLRTSEAVAFFGDAAAGDWENPTIIEQAFIANAADGRIRQEEDILEIEVEVGDGQPRAHAGQEARQQKAYVERDGGLRFDVRRAGDLARG